MPDPLQQRTDAGPLFAPLDPPPPARKIHTNSFKSHAARKVKLNSRAAEIVAEIKARGIGSDREIQVRLGYPEKCYVQPSISTMIREGILREVTTKLDPDTGRHVRVVGLGPLA